MMSAEISKQKYFTCFRGDNSMSMRLSASQL